ncbi:MAG: hypothetical protein KY476_10085 [Planctomycetes bacterium]|nr:hypothetical protein [Planctomycetota bacterium]
MDPRDLVFGIDGGGSKTVAWIATAKPRSVDFNPREPLHSPNSLPRGLKPTLRGDEPAGAVEPLGRGHAGPSNPNAVGWEQSLANIDAAVDAALADGGITGSDPLAAGVVALAGGDRPEVARRLDEWNAGSRRAERLLATHDAAAVLAAVSNNNVGIALIAGTGSFAWGRAASGAAARSGGWGHLLGDEGSGYRLALDGLSAVAHAADGRGPSTELTKRYCERFGAQTPHDLIPIVYARQNDRGWIAALSGEVVLAAGAGDAVAAALVDAASSSLAELVWNVAERLDMAAGVPALGLAGGLLVHNRIVENAVDRRLAERALPIAEQRLVPEPVVGAVRLAQAMAAGDGVTG